MAGFETGGRDHESRNVGDLKKLERAKKPDPTLGLPEGRQLF